MKLRIKGNSIRLRLLRTEVDKFASSGCIADETSFGAAFLRYSLTARTDIESISATFDRDEIAVTIPVEYAREWTTTERVGFEAEQAVGNGEFLTITIEKDFICLDRPSDPDRADAYPNPATECPR